MPELEFSAICPRCSKVLEPKDYFVNGPFDAPVFRVQCCDLLVQAPTARKAVHLWKWGAR